MFLIKTSLKLLVLANLAASSNFANSANPQDKTLESKKVVRTYISLPEKIDPAHILTMADLQLSMTLASTLVEFNESREIVSALAEKWTVESNKLKFVLRPGLKWSNGDLVKASEFKNALFRAKKLYASDLKSLFDAVQSIDSLDDRTIVFTVRDSAGVEGLLQKLCEPMYGLVAFHDDLTMDYSKSSGPYSLSKSEKKQVTLVVNTNWFDHAKGMAQAVELRATPTGINLIESFADDKWANLVSGITLQKQATRQNLSGDKYSVWERSLDSLFALYPSRPFLQKNGAALMRKLNRTLHADSVMNGYSGYSTADQFFPRGYVLWTKEKPKQANISEPVTMKALKVIVPSSYRSIEMDRRLKKAIQDITHSEVEVEFVELSLVGERMKKQDFDILATGIAVADPNFEGAVSFFIEREPPFIPSTTGANDFAGRVSRARKLSSTEQRADSMREIIRDAQAAGHVTPLFHFSSFAIAKDGVDLSGLSGGAEMVLFSKVRIK